MVHKQEPVRWAVSVISHGHGERVLGVLTDVHAQLQPQPHRLILTFNIPEDQSFLDRLPASIRPHLEIRQNATPLGFASNHNAALMSQAAQFILMADPDLGIKQAIFPHLERSLALPDCGIVSPRAVTPEGALEDNGRPIFTPGSLLKRYLGGLQRDITHLSAPTSNTKIDWLAGLFLAMRQDTFQQLNGLDSQYFMYCEDIDLGLRTQQLGLRCELLHDVQIVHPANRNTLKRWSHLIWHVRSLLRLWRSDAYRELRQRQRNRGL